MTRRIFPHAALAASLLAAVPALAEPQPTVPPAPSPAPTVTVTARAQTVPVGTGAADAADDPAIWRDARRPSRSLIVATDKKAGLYVYGLDGKVRHFVPDGRLNNVDLIDMGRARVIVIASDRGDKAAARLRIYRLDTRRARLVPLGVVPGGAGEAYGVCLARRGDRIDAYSVLKHGTIVQVRIGLDPAPRAELLRELHLASQTEGCVVDPRSETLYVGEEEVGIWAFDARAEAPATPRLVAPVDGHHLVADVEGLALAPQGERGG